MSFGKCYIFGRRTPPSATGLVRATRAATSAIGCARRSTGTRLEGISPPLRSAMPRSVPVFTSSVALAVHRGVARSARKTRRWGGDDRSRDGPTPKPLPARPVAVPTPLAGIPVHAVPHHGPVPLDAVAVGLHAAAPRPEQVPRARGFGPGGLHARATARGYKGLPARAYSSPPVRCR